MQTPPRYSAVKVKGKPLYAYARKGQEVAAQPRPITVHALELLELEEGRLRVLLRCSRGTYARVLAEEIGVALGTVGHLGALRRLGSGPFVIEQALSFSQLAEAVAGDADWGRVLRPSRDGERVRWRGRDEVFGALAPWWVPPKVALGHLPRLELAAPDARRFLRTGVYTPAPPQTMLLVSGEDVLGVAGPGTAVALARETIRAGGRSSA
jgi:tRNA U55 pseudouridine synthase TruB